MQNKFLEQCSLRDVVIVRGGPASLSAAEYWVSLGSYMPTHEADKAKNLVTNKPSMEANYAGLDNEYFYIGKNMMVFVDTKYSSRI